MPAAATAGEPMPSPRVFDQAQFFVGEKLVGSGLVPG